MSDFNLTNFIAKFGYKNIQTTGAKNINTQKAAAEPYMPAQASSTVSSSASPASAANSASAQMASLAGEDTAAYVKDLLQLPKNLNEFIYMVQRGLTQMQMSRLMSQQYGAQRNTMTPTQAQILAQLQGLSAEELQAALKAQLMTTANTAQSLKNLQILFRALKKVLLKPLAEGIAVSVASNIGLLPLMLYYFGSVSLLTVPVNLVVVPLTSAFYPFLLLSALIASSAVSFSGLLGFVGLVTPHIALFISGGGRSRRAMLLCLLIGPLLVLLSDLLARTVASPGELPAGVFMAAIGVPFFIALLIRRARS